MECGPYKVIVQVCAEFDTEGNITPLLFVWEDGRRYEIDRILDVRRAASLKAGGFGIRYTCRVRGKQTYLFHEEDYWFMERK
ncbi:hypothetical protein SDC9_48340 [bioreactor metagenome]|uniref:Uncharacterized protein n=1 Tax=bioreactor metagenome TaxID=1076179 RepID=A0A644WE21_9ZZZZ